MYEGKITYDNPEVSEGLLFLGEKLISLEERDEFASQLVTYQGKHPKLFHFISTSQLKTTHPRVWWELNGGHVPLLRRIAIRLLSQPCSSSACERNWSAFDAAQTKKRARLLPETLDDLVYIRMNSLMMSKSVEVEFQDRMPIKLETLGDLPEEVDDGRDELAEPLVDESNAGGDYSWLDRRLLVGSSSSQPPEDIDFESII